MVRVVKQANSNRPSRRASSVVPVPEATDSAYIRRRFGRDTLERRTPADRRAGQKPSQLSDAASLAYQPLVDDFRTPRRSTGDAAMDLGIAGRKAIVCASSRGLGRGCATALAQEGCE